MMAMKSSTALQIVKEMHMKCMSAGFFGCNANSTRERRHVHCTVQASETLKPGVPKDMTRRGMYFSILSYFKPLYL